MLCKEGDIMFKNVSQKIKISACIYFFGISLITIYHAFVQYVSLGEHVEVLLHSMVYTSHTLMMNLVISLIVYGFGKIVEYYELQNNEGMR